MNMRSLIFVLPLALAACAQSGKTAPGTDDGAPPSHTDAPAIGDAALTGYRWKLETATDAQGKRIDALFPPGGKGLALTFADGNANVSGGCNRMGSRYTIDARGRLQVAAMRSTMMACEPALMRADEAISALLSTPQQVRVEESAPPRLQLVSASGETSSWIGEATAETRYGGPGETVFMEVAPQRIACNHPLIPDHQCLQVREIRYDDGGIKQPPGEWQAFYGQIEGFEFREGERKVLRLKKFKRDPAPADASSIVYVLDMVVESELVPASDAN